MKRILALLIVLLSCISMCACGSSANQPQKKTITSVDDVDWEDYCSSHAQMCAWYYYRLAYDADIGYSGISINTVKEKGDGVYVCYGKVSGKDNYGNSCSADFSVTCEVDLDKAKNIIDNGEVSDNPEDSDPFYDCVDDIETDYGTLRKK